FSPANRGVRGYLSSTPTNRGVPDFAWPATKQERCSNGSSEFTSRDYNSYRQMGNSSVGQNGIGVQRTARPTTMMFGNPSVGRVTPCPPFFGFAETTQRIWASLRLTSLSDCSQAIFSPSKYPHMYAAYRQVVPRGE